MRAVGDSARMTDALTHPRVLAWRDAGTTLDWTPHRVFVRRQGSGPALLLIHGFPTSGYDWRGVWEALTARFDCIAPDMLGFGLSSKPRGHAYAIGEQADLHEAVCEQMGVDTVHVLAHDYGDTVAQELLARHNAGGPLRVASLVLLNGGLFPETHHARPVQKLLASPVGPVLSRLMSKPTFLRAMRRIAGHPDAIDADELDAMWQLLAHAGGHRNAHRLIRYMDDRRTHRDRWVGALQNATIPIRVIDGLRDPVSGAHMVTRYRELIPHPDVVELPEAGHYPQVEEPDAVASAVLDFHARLGTVASVS